MTLLNATILLIEAACESHETPQLRRAIHRMERRLEILQERQKGIDARKFRKRIENAQCPACLHRWECMIEFEKHLTFGVLFIDGQAYGDKHSFACPHCGETWTNPNTQNLESVREYAALQPGQAISVQQKKGAPAA
jgi:transposase-like protein